MAESLFDNRYRYDYIYPRGRSGETLRALDTTSNNRPVVIKRPAPNDAPPIRAGQEVSINAERRALQRLSGHPVLTELLEDGQFFVGGLPHQYIVMERAEGSIIGDEVLELNAAGERLPELEMLTIIDQLLDLLHVAHAREIVYNDVDAKHLFWQRDNYQLKIIDWGNAVFLEGDEVTQQGISRQTDVFQVGELLYFILRGGRRAEVPRNAPANFRVDFDEDARRIHSRLQEIVSRALHPDLAIRYASIAALRRDLAEYRRPIEQDRNETVQSVADKLAQGELSKNELRALRTQIEPVLKMDPGYPPARETHGQIVDKLRDLSVEADLDAARIYMRNSKWNSAIDVLTELYEKAGTQTGALTALLRDICVIMLDSDFDEAPQAVSAAIEHLYDNQAAAAAKLLLLPTQNNTEHIVRWQIAERISSHVPEVLLLRPNLFRLNNALRQIAVEGTSFEEARAILQEVDRTLDDIARIGTDLPALRDSYRAVVDQLQAVNPLLQTVSVQHQFPNRRLPLSSLDRALNAAMALADGMHVIGRQAAGNPREALHALETSRSIDPPNPVWDELKTLLDALYMRLQSSQTYVPAADGSDLADWLQTTREQLAPFIDKLYDNMLEDMSNGLGDAATAWERYQTLVLEGNRTKASAALTQASDAVKVISPALSAWFRQLHTVVSGANYVERHALPGGLGRALADGWQAFDRGRLSDAERLGQQALEASRTEVGRTAAIRLQDLSRITRDWVERSGVTSAARSASLLGEVEELFTEREKASLRRFEEQMPSNDTYLKAMSKGIVTTFDETSSAALRILFFFYILQGTLDANEGALDDGDFWKQAASQTLAETGTKHIATRTLDEYIARQRDLEKAEETFNRITGKDAIPQIAMYRRQLEGNPQVRLLDGGIRSLRELEIAISDWREGDFRAAGHKLEDAINHLDEMTGATQIEAPAYREWLMQLMQGAADLAVQSREMRKMIEQRPDEPEDVIPHALNQAMTITNDLLGDEYAATIRQWHDTYSNFVGILTSDARRSTRLQDLNAIFRAMFIDQHPTYPLYRHWYKLLEAQSEFAAPPTDDPVPQVQTDVIPENLQNSRYAESAPDDNGGSSRMFVIGGIVGLLVIAMGIVAIFTNAPETDLPLTITATSAETVNRDDEASQVAAVLADETEESTEETSDAASTQQRIAEATEEAQFSTPTPNEREVIVAPSATSTMTPSPTPITPTATPTNTPTPTITPTPRPASPTPLPEGGLRGTQDVVALLQRTENLPFNSQVFIEGEAGYRFGIPTKTEGDVIRISLPQTLMETAFGNDAASRVRWMEAEIRLLTFNPVVLEEEDTTAFFGILMESANDGNNIGIQVDQVSNTVINIYSVANNSTDFLTQRSINIVSARLRIERDTTTGNVIMSFNGEQIGDAIPFIAADAPILPTIFVKDGGVLVEITEWEINLR